MRIRIHGSSLVRRAELALAVLISHRNGVLRAKEVSERERKRIAPHLSSSERTQASMSPVEVPDNWNRDMKVLTEIINLPRGDLFEADLSIPEYEAVERWRKMIFRPPPSNQEIMDYA